MILHDIRYTEESDRPFLETWLRKPGELQWFPPSNEEELKKDLDLWIGFARFKASLTATIDDIPYGIATLYLMPYRKVAHHALFRVIVDPAKRRQGLGTSLIKNLLHLARNYFRLEALHIELYDGCPLIPLLEKMGFSLIATQKDGAKIEGRYVDRHVYLIDLITWRPT